jgi:hypothetical protein
MSTNIPDTMYLVADCVFITLCLPPPLVASIGILDLSPLPTSSQWHQEKTHLAPLDRAKLSPRRVPTVPKRVCSSIFRCGISSPVFPQQRMKYWYGLQAVRIEEKVVIPTSSIVLLMPSDPTWMDQALGRHPPPKYPFPHLLTQWPLLERPERLQK